MIQKHNISAKFGLNISGHKDIDFVDINLDHDTVLFLDPCLIECCKDDFSLKCSLTVSDYFRKLYFVFEENDRRNILSHLSHLGERNEVRLGYGNGLNGKAKTSEGMMDTLSGLKHLIKCGLPIERAIDIPLLMPRFAEDCMSDMLMNILYKHFSEYTIEQCRKYGVPTVRSQAERYYWDIEEQCWKLYEGESLVVDGKIILLIPKQYVCRRLYYSTGHFFMSKIAPMLQKDNKVIIGGRERKPSKLKVRKEECQKHGSLLCATLEHVSSNPKLLSEYHLELPENYRDRCFSDSMLDCLIYGDKKDTI